jgi:hypothetical protein
MILRRAIYLLLSRFVATASRLPVLNAFLVIQLVCMVQCKPYRHDDDNFLEIALLANAVFYLGFFDSDKSSRILVPAISLVFALLVFVVIVARQLRLWERFVSFLPSGLSSSFFSPSSSILDSKHGASELRELSNHHRNGDENFFRSDSYHLLKD